VALAAPVVVARRPRARLLAIPAYWHLLSLDAPTVAILWAWALGRAAHVRSSPVAIAVLGIGTWLIYIADRLLDSRRSAPAANLRERHFFHARHRTDLLVAGSIAAAPLLWLIADHMSAPARREDTLLFAVSMLYFTVVHLRPLPMSLPFRREFAVGVIFAGATAIPAWSMPGAPHGELLLPVLLFAALCCLNCLAIDDWERSGPSRRFPVSAAALVVAAAAAALTLHQPASASLDAAALLSALILFGLDRLRYRGTTHSGSISAFALRIAADAALLTPLLLLLPWHASWRV
jgi:hypothetical protein